MNLAELPHETAPERPGWAVGCRVARGVEGALGALSEALRPHGMRAVTPAAAERHAPGLALLDGVDAAALELVREAGPQAGLVVLHAGRQPLAAADHWALLRAGAVEVLDWSALPAAPAIAAARVRRWREVDALMASPLVQEHLLGAGARWTHVLRQVIEAARFGDHNVLLIGESGTGKELVARLIHTLDGRDDKGDLVVLDCATLAPDLAGSEFFGHERGAYTGAVGGRDGAFALADRGTLFLDEVGELPLRLQPQLLRVTQERSYKRLGANRWCKTSFRLVCATHRELAAEAAAGRFRHDLYHRLAACVFHLPPLRERREDIVPLAQHFLAEAASGPLDTELIPPVREALLQRDYPGNVRELRQLMTRIASRHVGGGPITVGDLPDEERPPGDAAPPDWRDGEFDGLLRRALAMGLGLRDISAQAADAAIRVALDDEDGNLKRAARRLGVTDRALQLRRASRGAISLP
ncbi:MAG: sigma 54-interacting transcriptional regulator [Rubrivivax sp.]|nr:sigma 54-interacting transcriptional regulator [Rubrivivax sp.]